MSQDNKEKYCQGKGKEFDTITWLGLIWTTKENENWNSSEWRRGEGWQMKLKVW